MHTSDHLLLVELHRGGSARLRKALSDVVGELTRSPGTTFADSLAQTGKPVIGLVCNPLTWYLNLWRMGCEGRGDVHKRLTSDLRWGQLRARLNNRDTPAGQPDPKEIPAGWGPERARDYWYADAQDVGAFREWLRALLAERGLRKLADHAWGCSPMAKLTGPMSFEFYNLFVRGAENMEKSVASLDDLRALRADKGLPAHFVRVESAGPDLLQALEAIGIALSDEQRAAIAGLKDRAAADEEAIARFYDADSLRLVAKREVLINEQFGYRAPGAAARASRKAAPQDAESEATPAAGKGKGKAKAKAEPSDAADASGTTDKPAKAGKPGRAKPVAQAEPGAAVEPATQPARPRKKSAEPAQ